MAGILQSIFVLLLSFFLLTYFKYLPLPIVAAVIVIVAIRMVDHHHIVRFWKMDKTVFFLTFFVAAICVLVEPTSGIVVGMVLALLMFSDMTSRIHSELVMTDDDGSKKFVSDKEIQVGEVEKSKRERKKQHLKELKSAAADEDVRTHSRSCASWHRLAPTLNRSIRSLFLWSRAARGPAHRAPLGGAQGQERRRVPYLRPAHLHQRLRPQEVPARAPTSSPVVCALLTTPVTPLLFAGVC
jgi:hypothetical protein